MSIEELKYKLSNTVKKIEKDDKLIEQLEENKSKWELEKFKLFNELEEKTIKKYGKSLIRTTPDFKRLDYFEIPKSDKNKIKIYDLYKFKKIKVNGKEIKMDIEQEWVLEGNIIIPYNEVTDEFDLDKAWIDFTEVNSDLLASIDCYFDYYGMHTKPRKYKRNIKEDIKQILLHKNDKDCLHDMKHIDSHFLDCPKEYLRKWSKIEDYQMPFAVMHCTFYMP